MDYSSFSPPTHGGPWHDLFTYDSSDAGSITSCRRPSDISGDNTNTLPPLSLHLSKKRSRRAQANGPVSDRGRERIKELEQRIRELESSASETTARATIKVLQTRVRDLEAEVDCLTMRLENAELAMSRTLAEGRSMPKSTTPARRASADKHPESSISQNLFAPLLATAMSTQSLGTHESYIAGMPNQACDFTMSNSSNQSMAVPITNDSATPRSVNGAVRPLISWDTSPVSANQRPTSATAQQMATWRGGY